MNYEPHDITRGREYEKSLQKIATRGIVQLFNTVRKQQHQHSSSSTKKEKKQNGINKGEFLDMLKNIDSDETSYKVLKNNAAMVKISRWFFQRDVTGIFLFLQGGVINNSNEETGAMERSSRWSDG